MVFHNFDNNIKHDKKREGKPKLVISTHIIIIIIFPKHVREHGSQTQTIIPNLKGRIKTVIL